MQSNYNTLKYIFSVHLLALVAMSFIRICLITVNSYQFSFFENNLHDLFWILALSLTRGIWFDNIIATTITILPLTTLFVSFATKKKSKSILSVINIYYIVIYTLVWATDIADIPYFNYFFKHLDLSIIMWKNDPTAYKMLLEESSYYIYFLFFIIFSVAFGILITMIKRKFNKNASIQATTKTHRRLKNIIGIGFIVSTLSCGTLGLFTPNPFGKNLNSMGLGGIFPLLGVNPVYNFIDSTLSAITVWNAVDKIITLKEAVTYEQGQLGINTNLDKVTPIIRDTNVGQTPQKVNIIIILMESMSSDFLSANENGKDITPFLNSLINKSYYFSNIFSPGNHTSQGIAATLYGQPCIFEEHMLNQDYKYSGLSKHLKGAGYKTSFFLTHDPAFDNTGFSASANSFTNVFSINDYPADKQVNALGVADDYLFEFGVNKINEQQKNNDNPFFATFLTVSNHPPYIIPDPFKSISSNQQYQIVSFCDNAIRLFFEEAAKQTWFENTIFVLLGDHGAITSPPTYEVPISLHHIPLIIYSPLFKDAPQRIDKVGSQIDTYPTIMGLLKQPYQNNSMGIDLMKTERTYAPISGDGMIAAIDKEYLLYYNLKTKTKNLYKYKENDRRNYTQEYQAKADSMLINSAAILQISNYMIKENLTQY